MKSKIILIAIICTSFVYELSAQCVQCEGGDNSGTNASIIGTNNIASGNESFAGGKYSEAQGKRSIAFGENALTISSYSVAMGQDVTAFGGASIALGRNLMNTSPSIIFGSGFDDDNRLKNATPNCLIVGFNSTKPTFFVGPSTNGANSTGRIGIGNVTAPQAKLHIREDENFDEASVYIQGYSESRPAYLWLGTKNYGLHKHSNTLEFLSTGYYVFNGGNLGIGTTSSPTEKLVVNGNIKQADRYQIETGKIQSYSREGLQLLTAERSGIIITERGQVAINKTTPTDGTQLDVNGKVKASRLQILPPEPDSSKARFAGYVMQSIDNSGNARWAHPSELDDGDWSTTETGDLFFNAGNVGIGTDTPAEKLDVAGNVKVDGTINFTGQLLHDDQPFETSKWDASGDNIYYTSGNVGIGTSQTDGNQLKVAGNISATTYYGDGSQLTGIEGDDLGNHIMTQNLLTAGNWINSDSDPDQGIYIDGGGRIGIGTSNTSSSALLNVNGKVLIGDPTVNLSSGYKLYVEDGILTEQVSVKTVANWADDVFDENYNLLPLDSLSKYIDKHKHLPELPDENSVKNNGYDIADMDAKLLRKIEELVLYIIELENEIKVLKEVR